MGVGGRVVTIRDTAQLVLAVQQQVFRPAQHLHSTTTCTTQPALALHTQKPNTLHYATLHCAPCTAAGLSPNATLALHTPQPNILHSATGDPTIALYTPRPNTQHYATLHSALCTLHITRAEAGQRNLVETSVGLALKLNVFLRQYGSLFSYETVPATGGSPELSPQPHAAANGAKVHGDE